MIFQSGQAGASGLFAAVEFIDRMGQYSIPAGQKLLQGVPLCRDVSKLSGFASTSAGGAPAANVPADGGQCDQLVLATDANAGDPYGIFQDQTIDNSAGAAALVVQVRCRFRGYGVVLAASVFGGAAVNVGSPLIISGAQIYAIEGARTIGAAVGKALATVVGGTLVSAPTDEIIGIPGSGTATLLINADINVI